jgi:hypothetical protein
MSTHPTNHPLSKQPNTKSDTSYIPMHQRFDTYYGSYLDEKQLAKRWHISVRTLQQWRYLSKGPQYCRFGSRIRYPLDEVEKYEREHLFSNTTQY